MISTFLFFSIISISTPQNKFANQYDIVFNYYYACDHRNYHVSLKQTLINKKFIIDKLFSVTASRIFHITSFKDFF